jgi:hypothetical protein
MKQVKILICDRNTGKGVEPECVGSRPYPLGVSYEPFSERIRKHDKSYLLWQSLGKEIRDKGQLNMTS